MCPTIAEMGVRLWHVCSWRARWRILRCRGFAAISQLRNTLRNGALAAKLGVFTFWHFTTVSQLRNEGHCAAKWHSCAKKWLCSCEILCEMELSLRKWDLSRFGASQPFRSCEMGVPVLRSGTRVPKVVSQLRKFSQRGQLGCELVSQQNFDFAEAAKSRRPLFFPCFSPVFGPFDSDFAPILLRFFSFNFFAIPLDFDHPKTYITSKQTRIKALKSKLKHWNQN